ncbi:MAG: bifunctional (p)ppGpp synthetase/guanosine-3',5'-bis(diphosphate) 3'-pyrophosphohydrolase, partial [Butyricicoccus sp.]|nr:bifunctional (p)ppGpp synthetase/guanosine-3',5'-bis(diphosphate) 3'-pyrophosphohydrolase [Butyricicoccus sp.]
ICAGLLHDCMEDTNFQYDQIAEKFGTSVADLVDGVTRLGQLHYSKEQEQMEDLRKMLIAMAKDIRVILIKLADRLHNMRTIQFMTVEKQRSKSLETMEIYAPIAHRLGMQKVKWELEDLSLQCLDPIGYKEIVDGLERQRSEHEEMLERIKKTIGTKLNESGIKNSISARVKHIYSIYRKMYEQNKSIDEIYDICAVRVIVDSVADCYNVLGYVHDLYKPIPGRFKDYISTPKPNGYRSLHTTVIGRSGVPFEVQIRTEEMHKMAEYGVAAHWKYKQHVDKNGSEETYAWIRQLLESQQDTEAEDFIKNIKVDLFSDEVFVFTPRGDVVNLPAGATPIDFAYGIHSAVGNRMTGCKINSKIAPIDYTLQNGDIVEILTSKETRGPKRDWLNMIKTSEARNKIKQWFKKECREENIEQGRADLDRELRSSLLYNHFMERPEVQANVLKKFGYPSLEELYAAIGYGGITVTKVLNKVRDEVVRARKQEENRQPLTQKHVQGRSESGVIVEDIGNCKVKFARCCTPVPGDDIIGYITRGYGVSVHRKDCVNVKHSSPEDRERWVKVYWDENHIETKERFNTALQISTNDRMGVMNDVLQTLTNNHINVKDFNGKTLSEGYGIINIVIEVTGLSQLDALKKKLRSLRGVINVVRQSM